MNIAVIGTGYVGLVTGACFAEMGNRVMCVDNNREKIDALQCGIMPIYEPGLEELVKKNIALETLEFGTSTEDAIQTAEVCFIAVGTPESADGSADGKSCRGYRQNDGT